MGFTFVIYSPESISKYNFYKKIIKNSNSKSELESQSSFSKIIRTEDIQGHFWYQVLLNLSHKYRLKRGSKIFRIMDRIFC